MTALILQKQKPSGQKQILEIQFFQNFVQNTLNNIKHKLLIIFLTDSN